MSHHYIDINDILIILYTNEKRGKKEKDVEINAQCLINRQHYIKFLKVVGLAEK